MKMNDMLWVLVGIGVIVLIAREPSLIGAFAKDVSSVPRHISGARDYFRG